MLMTFSRIRLQSRKKMRTEKYKKMNGKRQAERRNQVLELTSKSHSQQRYQTYFRLVYLLLAGIYLTLEKRPKHMSENT